MNVNLYIKNEKIVIIFLFFLSTIIRLPAVHMYGDTSLENEWEIIVFNLSEHGKLAFRNFDGFLLPNLYMPPLYPLFLYFFKFFNFTEQNYILVILYSQLILSSLSVAIFYKINKKFFTRKISIFGSLLFSCFPLYIYACTQISSITLQIFFTILFFHAFFEILNNNKKKSYIFLISISSGLLILLRGEFFIIFFISLIYLLVRKKFPVNRIFIILMITIITISPYLVRNFINFNTFTITKSFGYNLWKGNNPNSKVEGSEIINEKLLQEINRINKDKFYQIKRDKIFFNEAIENISNNPLHYFFLYIQKFLSYLFIDISSSQNHYYNYLHVIPVLLLSLTSLIGMLLVYKKPLKYEYLILIFIIYLMIFSIFFILPRYKLILIPIQLIFTNVLLDCIIKKYFSK